MTAPAQDDGPLVPPGEYADDHDALSWDRERDGRMSDADEDDDAIATEPWAGS